MNYLYFLQNMREMCGGIFDSFMLQLTALAEQPVTFLLLAAVYWCIDKRTGQLMGWNVSLACTCNQFVKAVCKIERPWVRDARIRPVEDAISGAGGYSFPSGHTQRAAATWGAAGYGALKKGRTDGTQAAKTLGLLCWALVALIMFSRNYLGVHTFADVAAAAVLGVCLWFVLDLVLDWVEKGPGRDILAWAAGCFLCFLPMLRIGCMTNAGAGMGILTGWLVERRLVRFDTEGSLPAKAVRLLTGGCLQLGIYTAVRSFLKLFMEDKYAGFFTMFAMTFFIMAVHPAVFTWLESRKRSSVEKRRGILAGMLCLVMVLALMSGISWKQQSSTNRQEDAVVSEADSAEADAQADAAAGEEADSAESDAQGNAAAGEETDTQADAAAGEEADTARIQLIGHRGYNALYPENTMPSFEAALNVGVDYIETDVQMTKDGRLVLFHDDTLEHITGAEGKIADYTYDELLELDFGTSFEVSFAGTQIAALEELLALVKDSGCRIYLELKDIGDVEGFAEAVLDMVEQYEMTDCCVFASFRYEYLEQIKAIDPDAEILLNTTSDSITLAEDFPAEYYGLYVGTMTEDTVNALHQAGRTVFVWTVNTPEAVRRVIDMGVDGIVTNEPEWTATLLNRQE